MEYWVAVFLWVIVGDVAKNARKPLNIQGFPGIYGEYEAQKHYECPQAYSLQTKKTKNI